MEARDRRFMDSLSFSFEEPSFPGMVERLQVLSEHQLGRGIFLNRRDPQSESALVEVMVGYILPLDINQSEHIVILRNGEVFKTSPRNDDSAIIYREKMAPNSTGVIFTNPTSSVDDIVKFIDGNAFLKSKIILRGNSMENIDQLNKDLEIGLRVAIDLKYNLSQFATKREISEAEKWLIEFSGTCLIQTLDGVDALLAPDSLIKK